MQTALEMGLHSSGKSAKTCGLGCQPYSYKEPEQSSHLGWNHMQGSTSTFNAGRIHPAEEMYAVDPCLQQGSRKCQKVGEAGEWENVQPEVALARSETITLWTVFSKEGLTLGVDIFDMWGKTFGSHCWSGPHAVLIHVTNYMWSRAKSTQLPKWDSFQNQCSVKINTTTYLKMRKNLWVFFFFFQNYFAGSICALRMKQTKQECGIYQCQ